MDDSYGCIIPEKREQLRLFAQNLARTVREYFKDPEHRRQFEEWYFKKYGRSYV